MKTDRFIRQQPIGKLNSAGSIAYKEAAYKNAIRATEDIGMINPLQYLYNSGKLSLQLNGRNFA